MRCLVTGGTGFIGSNLALELQNQGNEVIITGFDKLQSFPEFNGKVLHPTLIGIDWESIGSIDVLFHQAAISDTTLYDEREMYLANFEAPKELFKRVVANGCKHIVYASSTAVYGNVPAPYKEDGPVNPLNPYAKSKLDFDRWVCEFNKEHPDVIIVGLRYCNVYGPRESRKGKMATLIFQMAQQMLKGNPKLFKYGEQKRDYIYVKDVVRANLLASKATQSCLVNCGSGNATTFNDLLSILNQTLGLDRKADYIDNPYANNYQSHTECDMTLAKKIIGFVPKYDIRSGIKDYHDSGWLVLE